MTGVVLWTSEFKGYGEIRTATGQLFVFSKYSLSQKTAFSSIKPGSIVNFLASSEVLLGSQSAEGIRIGQRKRQATNQLELGV